MALPLPTTLDEPTAASLPDAGFNHGPALEALQQALHTLDGARSRCRPTEMMLALSQVARCYRGLKAPELAEDFLQQALRWAALVGAADAEVRLLCDLAETACELADLWVDSNPEQSRAALERTREHALDAALRAAHVSDPDWEVKVLLRVSDVLSSCGEHSDATALQSRAMRLMVGDTTVPWPDSATPAQVLAS